MNKESQYKSAVKQYEFIPEIWDIIRSYRKKPIEAKLWKMGIKPLVSLVKDYTFSRFTNMNSSKIPLEQRKTILIKCLMEYHINKGNIVLEEKKKEVVKMVYKNKVQREIKVGDMINYNLASGAYCYDMCGGLVVKIGKSKVTIQLYGAKLIHEDWESKRNQTYGYDVYSWEEASQHVRPVPGRWPKISVSPNSLTLVDNYLIQKSFDYGR